MRVWDSFFFLHGHWHATSPTDTIQSYDNTMPCTCIYFVCTCLFFVHTWYMHVCICLSLSDGVLCRPPLKTLQAVCGLTSIFSSLVESSLFRIHPPLCPCLMVTVPLGLQRGCSTYTGLHILSCVGCQPSWLSGLVRTCRMNWDFPTKLIRGPSLVLVGPPLS